MTWGDMEWLNRWQKRVWVGSIVVGLLIYAEYKMSHSGTLPVSRYAETMPYTAGVYAIWYDEDSVMQWAVFSDTVAWNADSLIHPLFVEGSVYWEARSPDTAWCYCPDSLGHYTVPCFFLLQRE